MMFYWDRTLGVTQPRSFFPEEGSHWFWPGSGLLVGDHLLLFVSRVKAVSGGLGFEGVDWDACLVANPQDAPDAWQITDLAAPENDLHIFLGGGSVFADGDHVVAFGYQEPSHDLYVARWLGADVHEGDLAGIEWWCGSSWGGACAPAPVLDDIATELSVHRDASSGCWTMTYLRGFGAADLVVRWAPAFTGPWSDASVAYQPPEQSWKDAFEYAGKAHPSSPARGCSSPTPSTASTSPRCSPTTTTTTRGSFVWPQTGS